MSIPLPNPALFARRPSSTSASTESPAPTEDTSPPAPKKPFVRKPHLTQRLNDHPGLQAISAELHEMEDINRKHGWYDRNRNGRQRNKTPKRNSR